MDLRHKVSHGGLPDIRVLRKAADDALAWLWGRWWKSNATGDSALSLERWKERYSVVTSSTFGAQVEGGMIQSITST